MPDARVTIDAETDINSVLDSFLKLNTAGERVRSTVESIGRAVENVGELTKTIPKTIDDTLIFEIESILDEVSNLADVAKEVPKIFDKYTLPDMDMPFYDEGWEPDDIKVDWMEGVFDDLQDILVEEFDDFSKGVHDDIITDIERWFTPEVEGKTVSGSSMGFNKDDTKILQAEEKSRKEDTSKVVSTGKTIGKVGKGLGKILTTVLDFVSNAAKNSVVLQNMYNLVLLPLTTILNFVLLPVLQALIPVISGLMKTIVDNRENLSAVGTVIAGIMKAFTSLEGVGFDAMFTLFDALHKLSEMTWGAIGTFIDDIVSAFGSFFEDIVKGCIQFINGEISFSELLTTITTAFVNLFSGVVSAIWTGIKNMANTAATFGQTIAEKLREVFAGIFQWFSDVWGALTSGDPLGSLGTMLDNWINPNKNNNNNISNNTSTTNYYFDPTSSSFKDNSGQIISVDDMSLKGGL